MSRKPVAPQHIEDLPGVGKKTKELLATMGITTIADLLYHFPRTYLDYRHPVSIEEATANPDRIAVLQGTITSARSVRIRGGRTMIRGILHDQTGTLPLVWFFGRPIQLKFEENTLYTVAGKLTAQGDGFMLHHPAHEKVSETSLHTNRLVPVYPTTKGLHDKSLRKMLFAALQHMPANLHDPLPATVVKKERFAQLPDSLSAIHFPKDESALRQAQRRFIFTRLLQQYILHEQARRGWSKQHAPVIAINHPAPTIPFALTRGQQTVLKEIHTDLAKKTPMHRLLQGDVGSGKTIIALLAAQQTLANGYQVAFLAPTSILAEQHLVTAKNLRLPAVLLTGATSKKDRTQIHAQLRQGKSLLIIGTHALLQDNVPLPNLGLVIIDEQHRFGVGQRSALQQQKTLQPHLLSLTATPIPRTLQRIAFGHLDVSTLKEKPKNRTHIHTRRIPEHKREAMYGFVAKRLEAGEQVYVVCPRIDSDDTTGQRAAVALHEELARRFPHTSVGLLHGRLAHAKKEAVMSAFRAGTTPLLVATSVIEVGMDVPKATVMIIEHADRFGLAQLHQMRGRVGRSAATSWCFLMGGDNNEKSRERLDILTTTNDGFVLAEADLRLRGPGALFGTEQSGLVDVPFVDVLDTHLIRHAHTWAERLVTDKKSVRHIMHDQAGTGTKNLLD